MTYKEKIMKYSEQLNTETQKKLVVAVRDLRKQTDKRTFLWIYTALNLKEISEWEKWGFGLMWHKEFIAQVNKRIYKIREASAVDLDTAWDSIN